MFSEESKGFRIPVKYASPPTPSLNFFLYVHDTFLYIIISKTFFTSTEHSCLQLDRVTSKPSVTRDVFVFYPGTIIDFRTLNYINITF